MKYLCLIHLDERDLDAMPGRELDALNAAHLELNDRLRSSGHFIEAEALEPVARAAALRVREGKVLVTDGPFTETKEHVAGFYLLEARDLDEAIRIAATIPSATFATIEIRPTRQLVIEGRHLS
jgi:hypothetical protein